jgi:hypothetical protein
MSVRSVTQFFPCAPEYATWEDWTGSLTMYFGSEPIGTSSEDNWQDGANQISNLPTFAAYPVSGPETFGSWQEWAVSFTQIVNGPSR